jgi:multicomponent Na+:H+ antiporter subunit F
MTLQSFALYGVMSTLGVALLLVMIRLIKGPTLPDRVVALDIISVLGIGFVATYCVGTGRSAYLDVGIVLGLLVFLGTVAFARYLERRV